jgi:hypothetical protein
MKRKSTLNSTVDMANPIGVDARIHVTYKGRARLGAAVPMTHNPTPNTKRPTATC